MATKRRLASSIFSFASNSTAPKTPLSTLPSLFGTCHFDVGSKISLDFNKDVSTCTSCSSSNHPNTIVHFATLRSSFSSQLPNLNLSLGLSSSLNRQTLLQSVNAPSPPHVFQSQKSYSFPSSTFSSLVPIPSLSALPSLLPSSPPSPFRPRLFSTAILNESSERDLESQTFPSTTAFRTSPSPTRSLQTTSEAGNGTSEKDSESRPFPSMAAFRTTLPLSQSVQTTSEGRKKRRRRGKEKKTELTDLLRPVPGWGVGYCIAKSHWNLGNFYLLTNVALTRKSKGCKVSGIFFHKGKPDSGKEQKVSGVNKDSWKLVNFEENTQHWKTLRIIREEEKDETFYDNTRNIDSNTRPNHMHE